MRNRYLERFDRLVKVRIVGSNINNYLRRVIKKKINIIELIPISFREIHVILKYSDYKRLLEFKSIYEVEVIDKLGSKKIEANVKRNFWLILFMLLGLFLIILLSRMIFSIDIIHSDKRIRELVREELDKRGIDIYRFKFDYKELDSIKKDILEDNKDVLEWIEIVEYGTKYIIRVEERKINNKKDINTYQSIVSKKDAVLTRVDAISGEKVKFVDEYVKEGEVVISGYITKPDGTKIPTIARGSIYGEVWYRVNIDYPIVYQESNYTGKIKNVYAFYFFNKRYGLFDFDNYKFFETDSRVLISCNFPNIKFTKEKIREVVIRDDVYTEDIAKIKAIDYIKSKMLKDNSSIVEISDVKILASSSDYDSINMNLFIRVIEDIGEVVGIEDVAEEG